jgi:hypothetical protein
MMKTIRGVKNNIKKSPIYGDFLRFYIYITFSSFKMAINMSTICGSN